ncbi:hypothetical protein FRC02_000755 [Tulasnella sp. 418]|nr:hypothetical protein FRC02_000755 [Tulasnella sp. 418]
MSKALRKQPTRQAQQNTTPVLDPDTIAKRTKRRLEDLERSNYIEPKLSFAIDEAQPLEGTSGGLGSTSTNIGGRLDRARDTLSLHNQRGKKKSTQAVRSILLYRKTFNTLLEESGLVNMPGPHYLTAVAPPPKYPPRSICQVCGYLGNYKCLKCGVAFDTLACQAIHDETGCERRLIS